MTYTAGRRAVDKHRARVVAELKRPLSAAESKGAFDQIECEFARARALGRIHGRRRGGPRNALASSLAGALASAAATVPPSNPMARALHAGILGAQR